MKLQHGISLIEMTIILAVIGLLLASLLVPFAAQMDIAKIQDTKQTLEQIKQVLIDYATINDRLPCPATDAKTGMEDQANCEDEAYLPWANLGLGRYDAWGNPFRYAVSQSYTKSGKSPNIIIIQENQSDNIEITAVIFSYGKNGQSDQPDSTFFTSLFSKNWFFPMAFAGTDAENRSLPGGNNQVYSQGSNGGGHDDILVFVPKATLVSASQQLQPSKPPRIVVSPNRDEDEYTPELATEGGEGNGATEDGEGNGATQGGEGNGASTGGEQNSTDTQASNQSGDNNSQDDENHTSTSDNSGEHSPNREANDSQVLE